MISDLLQKFIAKAETHVIGEPPYGSTKEIILETLGSTRFLDLDVRASFGQGRATAVPWIGFFGYGQKTEAGIYPVFLYFKEQKQLVLAYGVSENNPPERVWSGMEGKVTIREYFAANELGMPARYGSSIVHNVYETNAELDEAEIQQDLQIVVEKFKSVFENDPLAVPSESLDTLSYMKEQVMIYEVKSAAHTNAIKLFSPDRKYFYWNHSKFGMLNVGEYVLVVDVHTPFVVYSKLDAVDIATTIEEGKTTFHDLGSSYEVSGEWDKFVRLEVLLELTPPAEWQWKTLGSTEMVYLNGPRVNPDNAANRILNIGQLMSLSDDPAYQATLDSCLTFFTSFGTLSPPKVERQIAEVKFGALGFDGRCRSVLTAIKTKPFVLLAGLSGTGKSRLVRTLAYMTCFDPRLQINASKPGNFELVAVKPNWHDSGELMGYVSRINGEKYLTTAFLKFVAKAWKYPNVPFFLCLDEMNLAPVEQYFAEYLSIVETRAVCDGQIRSDYLLAKSQFENLRLYEQILEDLGLAGEAEFAEGVSIPTNLVVIGTVNMDETTHSFSRKVLDRAMTFEMNKVDLSSGLNDAISDWSYPDAFVSAQDVTGNYSAGSEVVDLYPESGEVIDYLKRLNEVLEGTPFKVAYRVRDEFLIYCHYSSLFVDKPDNWLETALDEMTAMKILSRIEGDEPKTVEVLAEFDRILNENFPITSAKLNEMRKRLQISGYTSFWS